MLQDLGHGHHHHHGGGWGPGWGPGYWPTQISYPPIAISERIQCSKVRPHPAPPGLYFDPDNKTWCWPVGTTYRPMGVGATTDVIEYRAPADPGGVVKRQRPNGRIHFQPGFMGVDVQGHPVRNGIVAALAARKLLKTSRMTSALIGAAVGYLTR